MKVRKVILLFGMVNAALFSALLPLWEGFDEPFHYGYVETLWQTRQLPALGRTLVPGDVVDSFPLAPFSHVVQKWIPGATSYDAWFALPQPERERRRHELELLTPGPRISSRPNYEAHHPPLAYLLLAPVDWMLSRWPITVRVLMLRLFGAVGSVVLIFFGAASLCRALEVPERFATAALFLIFCSEMLYATTAHVANDWLAVGLSALFLAALAAFVRAPDRHSALRVAGWLALGLLSKAWFLVFAAAAAGVAVWLLSNRRASLRMMLPGAALALLVAGPWYVHNVALYGNVSGTLEEFDGIGFRQALMAAPHIDWWGTTGFLARGSLWTGNNSFNTFSRTTLNVILGLLAVGMAAWCRHRRAIQPAESAIFTAVLLFSAGVAYACCASAAYKGSNIAGPSPWYTQTLLAPVLVLVLLGLSRWKRTGRVVAGVTLALWSWVFVATWMVKLFPMYSGGGSAMRTREVWAWYAHGAAAHFRDLSLTALAPAGWLYAGLALSVGLTVGLGGWLIWKMATDTGDCVT